MANSDKIELEGTITKNLRGGQFEVTLKDNNMIVNCTLSGKLRMNKIRCLLGDTVTVAISPYDLTKGIIVWRDK